MRAKQLFVLGAAVLLTASARADFEKGKQTLAIFGGFGSSPTRYDYNPGDRETVTGSGPAFGGQYLYYFKGMPALAVGGDVESALNGTRHNDDLLTGFESAARVKSFVGLALVRMAYPKGEIRPYIFAGAGMHHSSQQLSAQPLGGNTWADGGTDSRTLVDKRKTSSAFAYGIGLDLYPADAFFIGMELRMVYLAGLNTGDTAALRAAGFTQDDHSGITQESVLMRFGWTFR